MHMADMIRQLGECLTDPRADGLTQVCAFVMLAILAGGPLLVVFAVLRWIARGGNRLFQGIRDGTRRR